MSETHVHTKPLSKMQSLSELRGGSKVTKSIFSNSQNSAKRYLITTLPRRPYKKSAIFVPCSSSRSPYVLIIPLEIGEKTLLFTCAQDGEQQVCQSVTEIKQLSETTWMQTLMFSH